MQGLKSRCLTYNASSESSKVRMSFIKHKLNNYFINIIGPFKISLDWVLTLTTQPSTKTFLQPPTKSDQPLYSPNNIHDYHQEKGYIRIEKIITKG